MSVRVEVQPAVLEWARSRSRIGNAALYKSFKKYDEWVDGSVQPTVKQLQAFASRTHTPFGMLLLSALPEEVVPIPDFRTVSGGGNPQPTADILETINVCQQRQAWYRDYVRSRGADSLDFVGSATVGDTPEAISGEIAGRLGWNSEMRRSAGSPGAALTKLRAQAETFGVLVMVAGIVGAGTRTHRTLSESMSFEASPLPINMRP